MSEPVTSSNLLAPSSPQTWNTVEKSTKPASWNFLPDSITQTARSGSTSTHSGSLLLLKDPPTGSNPSLTLTLTPGTIGHSGLVFNYVNENDFHLLVINQGRTGSTRHSIQLLKVSGNSNEELFRTSRTGDAPANCTLIITTKTSGSDPTIGFSYNGEEIFQITGLTLEGGFGLYSRGNEDSVFSDLRHTATAPAEVTPTQNNTPNPQIPTNSSTTMSTEISNSKQNDQVVRLQSYLGIKPPSAKTNVEFREVKTVALDSFYSALRKKLKDPNQIENTADTPNVELMDLRPRAWYRRMREILDLLELQQQVVDNKKMLIDSAGVRLKAQLDKYETDPTVTYEIIDQLEKTFNTYVGEHLEARRTSEALQDEKASLMREIRTNGYFLDDILGEENAQVKNAGYDFVIKKAKYGLPDFEPLTVDPQADLNDDTLWNATLGDLTEKAEELMKGNTVLEYNSEKDQLVSPAACQVLQDSLASTRADLATAEAARAGKDGEIAHFNAEIAAWSADVGIMNGRINANEGNDGFQYRNEHFEAAFTHGFLRNYPGHPHNSSTDSHLATILSGYPQYINPAVTTYRFNRLEITHATIHARRRERLVHWPDVPVFDWLLAFYNFFILDYPELGIQLHADYLHFEERAPFGDYTTMNYWIGWEKIESIFHHANQVCYHYINTYTAAKAAAESDRNKLSLEIQILKDNLANQTRDGFAVERRKFLQKWNSTSAYQGDYESETIYPDADPLAEFMIESGSNSGDPNKKGLDTHVFTPTENGYVNQHGQGVLDFLNSGSPSEENRVALFPVPDGSGDFSGELIKVVRNPKKSTSAPSLPVIKFVESYKITIGWQGFSLGELSHSINLVPGESKELVVDKKTKITTKTEQSRKEETSRAEKMTSSFEDNLQDTFSAQEKSDRRDESKSKSDRSNTGSSESLTSNEATSKFDWNVSAKGGFLFGSASAGMGGGSTSSRKNSLDNKTAFSIANSNEGTRASSQSSDVLRKNVSNSIKKVANETSLNNKVEFASMSSSEVSTEVADKEIIKLENPNVGRTVNYNFFQLQNLYGLTLTLTDVKIILNTGQELIDGTGINDIRVYEAEEFGKIYANSDEKTHDKFVAAVIARQIMKNYGDFAPGLTRGNGAIALPSTYTPDREALEVLNFSAASLNEENLSTEELLSKLKSALESLKGMPFYFRETEIQAETTLAVNTGAFHAESQVGYLPATEQYLEDRRDIETATQQAKLAHLQQQTKSGVFFPELPGTLTTLGRLPEGGGVVQDSSNVETKN